MKYEIKYDLIEKINTTNEKANLTLEELSTNLIENTGINATAETIKSSKVNKVKYNFDFKSFPPIIQHKYISLPSKDDSKNINNSGIHQEHRLLTKKYILS